MHAWANDLEEQGGQHYVQTLPSRAHRVGRAETSRSSGISSSKERKKTNEQYIQKKLEDTSRRSIDEKVPHLPVL